MQITANNQNSNDMEIINTICLLFIYIVVIAGLAALFVTFNKKEKI